MEQPEPPRQPHAGLRGREVDASPPPREPAALPPPSHFARLTPPARLRRIPPKRLAAWVSGGILVAVILLAAGQAVTRRLVQYVRDQPAYQVHYRAILLEPPVPAWFRGGREAFLDQVWKGSVEPTSFSALDLDGPRLLNLFRRNPWVRRPLGVRTVGYPSQVVVQLEYRTPVALARLPGGSKLAVDAEAVLLPREQIDLEAAEPLIWLDYFDAPASPEMGVRWNRVDASQGTKPDERVAQAARLAEFLRSRAGELAALVPRPFFLHILAFKESGLYVQITCGDRVMVWWDDPKASEAVREFDATGSGRCSASSSAGSPRPAPGQVVYLEYTRNGLRVGEVGGIAPTTGLKDAPDARASVRRR
ncbi:MAG: hypothetical protein U0835_24340 [Isosphaeraceae bacterium]